MFGILNVHKPQGVTSRDVVNIVQRRIRPCKVGHAGTLDPLASGVLLLAVGPASRLVPYLHQYPKTYRGTFILGAESASDDIETEVTSRDELPCPSYDSICEAAGEMQGTLMQRPPAYSAIKVAGKRAYDIAREGGQLELAERPVTVHSIEVNDYEFPNLDLTITCGSGTYIRSIGRDLAQNVGSAAVMSSLVRTEIGPFRLSSAVSMETLETEDISKLLLPAKMAVGKLPTVRVSEIDVAELQHGRSIGACVAHIDSELAAVDPQGNLVAILVKRPDGLGPKRFFKIDD